MENSPRIPFHINPKKNEEIKKIKNYKKEKIQKLEILNERIKFLEDSGKKKEDAKIAALKDNEVLTKKLQEVAKNWMTSKSLLEDFKNFIKQNVEEEKSKEFYKSLQMSEDL